VLLDTVRGTVSKAGKAWYCGYCSHRDQCLEDGGEMVQVTLRPKQAAAVELES
jgi:hypothetical protein